MTLGNPKKNQVPLYVPSDEQQEAFKRELMAFIEGNPHCFESVHPPLRGEESLDRIGHVTGSAWVLSPDKKAVLLTHHKKLNKWLQLGGHSDGESDVLLTALREVKEESGIDEIKPLSNSIFDIDIHTFPKRKNIEAHLHYDIRFCLQSENTNFSISEESNDLKWIPLDEITQDKFEESIVRMARKTASFLSTSSNYFG